MIIWGSRVRYTVTKRGVFECPRCRQKRSYLRKLATRYFTLFFIPILPLQDDGEVIECTACGGVFRPGVLVQPGDSGAVEQYMRDLRDKDMHVRQTAAMVLGRIGKPAVKPLTAALKDDDWRIRREAVDALAYIGGPPVVKALIAALQDVDFSVKTAAASALGRIGDPAAVNALTLALQDPDLRFAAGEAISRINSRLSRDADQG